MRLRGAAAETTAALKTCSGKKLRTPDCPALGPVARGPAWLGSRSTLPTWILAALSPQAGRVGASFDFSLNHRVMNNGLVVMI